MTYHDIIAEMTLLHDKVIKNTNNHIDSCNKCKNDEECRESAIYVDLEEYIAICIESSQIRTK